MPETLHTASAVILAGGKSERMGTNKALLPVDGHPLISHVIQQLHGRFGELFISADDPGAYAFTGLPVVRDREHGQGPLRAIATAIEAARSDTLFVMACDIPAVNWPLLRRMLAETERFDCVVPRWGADHLEPLYAVYRRSALPEILRALAGGERKVRTVFTRLRVRYADAGGVEDLVNLNTPAELAKWLASKRPPLRDWTARLDRASKVN